MNLPSIEIRVKLLSNGRVEINAPMQNKVLCLGLLELAKDLVITYEPTKSEILQPKDFMP
jgi:hypothetical protein